MGKKGKTSKPITMTAKHSVGGGFANQHMSDGRNYSMKNKSGKK